MRLTRTTRTRTVVSGALWLVAASKGYAVETISLPAVVIGAAWPRSAASTCPERLRKKATR
jgi:hypothetical protein